MSGARQPQQRDGALLPRVVTVPEKAGTRSAASGVCSGHMQRVLHTPGHRPQSGRPGSASGGSGTSPGKASSTGAGSRGCGLTGGRPARPVAAMCVPGLSARLWARPGPTLISDRRKPSFGTSPAPEYNSDAVSQCIFSLWSRSQKGCSSSEHLHVTTRMPCVLLGPSTCVLCPGAGHRVRQLTGQPRLLALHPVGG